MLHPILLALVVFNVATLLTFAWDKRRAVRGGRRVPEARLLLLAWLAGFPGAWGGMALFRHKTRKNSFRIKMLLITIFNLGWLLAWWLIFRETGE